MALWFKRKKERVLEFNYQLLNSQLQNISDKLYEYRTDTGFKILEEMILMFYNKQVLEVNKLQDEKSLLIHQGKVSALIELARYIDAAKSERPKKDEKEQKPRGTINLRKTSNQAGTAI